MAQPDTSENGNERQRITATTPLHRHLLNEWYRDGRLTRQAFQLSQADKRQAAETGTTPTISVDHGDLVSPQEAHRLRRERGQRSDGVATIMGKECFEHGLKPIHDAEGTPEHVSIPIPIDWPNSKQRHIARLMADQAQIMVLPHRHEAISYHE